MSFTYLIELAVGDIGDTVQTLDFAVFTKKRAGVGDLLAFVLDRVASMTTRGIDGNNLVRTIFGSSVLVHLARH